MIGEAEEYLKENYPDDTFTYVSGRSPNWAYQYYELAFSSAEYDNQELTVFAEPDKNLKNDEGLTVYHYCDNYFQYYMKDEAEEYFYNIVKEALTEDIVVKVNISSGLGFAKAIKKDESFIQNFSSDTINTSIYIFYDERTEVNNENFKTVLDLLIDKKAYIGVTFLKTKNLDEVSSKKMSELMGHLSDYYTDREFFTTFDGVINTY